LFEYIERLEVIEEGSMESLRVLRKLMVMYKEQGEQEWIQRVVMHDIKQLRAVTKSAVGLSVFMDWSI
jgi:hypothetical protein